MACGSGGDAPPVVNRPPSAAGESYGDDGSWQPGASLAREYERRRSNRERRVRDAHPRISGLILACSSEPQRQKAFHQGEQGELEVATAVAKVDGVVLHNRRMPGGRGDIDHIAIVPSGIYLIDAKAVTGKVEICSRWFKPPLLFIAGRDCTRYSTGSTVRPGRSARPSSQPAMSLSRCAERTASPRELSLLRTVELRGHLLLCRKALAKRLGVPGPIAANRCG